MANYGVMGNIVGDLNDAPVRSNCILLTPPLAFCFLSPNTTLHHTALCPVRARSD